MYNVRFYSVDDMESFINDMCSLSCDVNIVDGSHEYDAKSTVGVMNLDFHKTFRVYCITDDAEQKHEFERKVRKYSEC